MHNTFKEIRKKHDAIVNNLSDLKPMHHSSKKKIKELHNALAENMRLTEMEHWHNVDDQKIA